LGFTEDHDLGFIFSMAIPVEFFLFLDVGYDDTEYFYMINLFPQMQ